MLGSTMRRRSEGCKRKSRRSARQSTRRLLFEGLEERKLLVLDPYGGIDYVLPDSFIPAVGQVESFKDETGEQTIGTGTLIRPQWVLTAAHMVSAFYDETFVVGGQEYRCVENWAAAGWFSGTPAGPPGSTYADRVYHDIGLLKLDRPVTNVEPLPLWNSPPSSWMTIIGYGMTGTGQTGFLGPQTAGTRRGGNIQYDDIDQWRVYTDFTAGIDESHTAGGDSGAPLIIRRDVRLGTRTEKHYFVAAVHSGSVTPNAQGKYGERSTAIRVDAHAEELYSIITTRDTLGNTYQRQIGGRPVVGQVVSADGVSQEQGGWDHRAPVITNAPVSDIVVSATGPDGAVVSFPSIEIVDDFDLHPTVTYSHESGSFFPVGETYVEITATDAFGNRSSAEFWVIVNSLPEVTGFEPPVSFPAGSGVRGIASDDFNRDGKPDLVTTNGWDNTVSVLLGNGDGTFQPAANLATGSSPTAVALGDFNQDDYPDLAVANQLDSTVSIFLGDGHGGFAAPSSFAVDFLPNSVIVGDFNQDSHLDLATANLSSFSGPGTVSVLFGNGNGTFQSAVNVTVGSQPAALELLRNNLSVSVSWANGIVPLG